MQLRPILSNLTSLPTPITPLIDVAVVTVHKPVKLSYVNPLIPNC